MTKKIPIFTTKAKVSDFHSEKLEEKQLTAQQILDEVSNVIN